MQSHDCNKFGEEEEQDMLTQIVRNQDVPQFVSYIHTCSDEALQETLTIIIFDRDLVLLGRLVAMVRALKPEQLQQLGTAHEHITKRLDRIAEKVGIHMPKRWRSVVPPKQEQVRS